MKFFKSFSIIFLFTISVCLFCSEKELTNLAKELNTPEKIAEWVQSNIKYVSKYGINEFNPPEEVYRLRSGNCAEMTNLTFYLLEQNQYHPLFMTIQLAPSHPKNHVVCVFKDKDNLYSEINNGKLTRGFQSYQHIAEKHDRLWWRYLIFDSLEGFAKFEQPLETKYQLESERVLLEFQPDLKNFSDFTGKINRKNKLVQVSSRDNAAVLFYQDDGNFDQLKNLKRGHSTGWAHLIYYKNITKNKKLKSVIISGKKYGNKNDVFQFFIIDFSGNILFRSDNFNHDIFSSDGFTNVELEVNLKRVPREFFILVKTFASRENGISIKSIPTDKEIYSYLYSSSSEVNPQKANAAIFPVLTAK
ncbi:MAG: hypothetical protein MJB14_03070 [Spirochaetes bacterium]|nr:hypothetical protein [Spirochaetota bacterium]